MASCPWPFGSWRSSSSPPAGHRRRTRQLGERFKDSSSVITSHKARTYAEVAHWQQVADEHKAIAVEKYNEGNLVQSRLAVQDYLTYLYLANNAGKNYRQMQQCEGSLHEFAQNHNAGECLRQATQALGDVEKAHPPGAIDQNMDQASDVWESVQHISERLRSEIDIMPSGTTQNHTLSMPDKDLDGIAEKLAKNAPLTADDVPWLMDAPESRDTPPPRRAAAAADDDDDAPAAADVEEDTSARDPEPETEAAYATLPSVPAHSPVGENGSDENQHGPGAQGYALLADALGATALS